MSSKGRVFLFKSPKENEPDKFVEVLEKADFGCENIPVLSFNFVNQETLKTHLCSIQNFSAIIFTSSRSVESVTNILKDPSVEIDVGKISCFAVGHITVEAAQKSGFDPKGAETGNSVALAEFILKHANNEDCRPFLYPCSNLHRDTLREILTQNGKEIIEVVSYETCPNEKLHQRVCDTVQEKGLPGYVVFFSPSGLQFTLSVIDDTLLPLRELKVIAIGPTTEKAICDSGYTPYATALKPDPQSLLQVLIKDGAS